MISLPFILPEPPRPDHLPAHAQWLAGEGAGSWFAIEAHKTTGLYAVSRFSPAGTLECKGLFESNKTVYTEREYTFTYPSHCALVSILQDDALIRLTLTEPISTEDQ